jgi:hypothetical protein
MVEHRQSTLAKIFKSVPPCMGRRKRLLRMFFVRFSNAPLPTYLASGRGGNKN